MIQAFSLIFNFFNIASPCSDMKRAFLTKNGLKSIFYPKKETHTRSLVFFL
jgi:hypothetical protein